MFMFRLLSPLAILCAAVDPCWSRIRGTLALAAGMEIAGALAFLVCVVGGTAWCRSHILLLYL